MQRRSRQATSRPLVWHGFGVTDRDPDDDVPPTPDSWRWRALDEITDVVVAVDSSGTIVYGNDFASHLLGHPREQVVGSSMADYLHPDDLVRALEVMSEIVTDSLAVAVTPAVYRLRDADGGWHPVEINATPAIADDHGDPILVIIGRYSGDRDLQDQLLGQLTEGVPADDMVPLVPEFGRWRHPHEHYAVVWRTTAGPRDAVGSALAVELLLDPTLEHPDTPWVRAALTGHEVVASDGELPPVFAGRLGPELGACWAMPVHDPLHGEPAVIVAWSRAGGPPTSVHRYSLELMSRALSLILQWRHQVIDLHAAARRDTLTGVPNRLAFFELFERLESLPDGPGHVGVLYVDLDGFKAVNDDHGHRTGDAVLAVAAERMESVLRPGDSLCRLGGDEFAVVCRAITGVADAEAVARRIVEAFERPFEFGELELTVGASVGIAVRPTADAVAGDLLHDADRALYRAKAEGRGTWRVAVDDAEP